jgi:Double-GTPase 2
VCLFYVLFYGALAFLYLSYLSVAVPIAAMVGFSVYALGMPLAYLAGLGKVLVTRPGGLPAPRRWPEPAADADPAVIQYFYGPAIADADHAVRVAYDNCRSLWRFGGDAVDASFTGDRSAWITVPLGIGAGAGMAVGTAAGALLTAGCALIHLLVVGVSAGSVRAAGGLLRGADSTLLRIKNIGMVCPHCGEKVPYPAYDCPNPTCASRHRDVRPGRLGVMRRRCRCGTSMNTLLLLGSSRMAAFCPHKGCEKPLEHRPGEAPEVVVPFFGATGAGKTRLLISMVRQLRAWAEEGQLTAESGDSSTASEIDIAEQILRSGRATTKTPVQPRRAHVIRLTSKKETRILHMFDAAGELFYQSGRTEELRYLNKAQTFILVIDPLSVEAFWERLSSGKQAELEPLRSTALSPDLAYQQTHQEIERMGVRLKKVRLAVVFSRADLINPPDGDVATWAHDELGLGNLIRSTRRNFKETRFFHTAAVLLPDGAVHESVAALMRWVFVHDGVSLPGGRP